MPSQEWLINFRTKKEGNAPKELAGELKEVKSGLIGAVEGFTGMSVAGLGIAGVISGIGVAMKESVDFTIAYAEQVRDLGRISGASAEESSKLIQVADDLKVEYSTLQQAAKALAKDGIALTTEELARSADEYLALPSAAERAQYAVDKFGKSGLELTKILEQGGAAIRAQADAQSGNLIMTEASLQKARDYEIAQDGLNDTLDGFKVVAGNAVIPALTGIIDALTNVLTYTDKLNARFNELSKKTIAGATTMEELQVAYMLAGYEIDDFGNVVTKNRDEMGNLRYSNARVVVTAEQMQNSFKGAKDEAFALTTQSKGLAMTQYYQAEAAKEAATQARNAGAAYTAMAADIQEKAIIAQEKLNLEMDNFKFSMSGTVTNEMTGYMDKLSGMRLEGVSLIVQLQALEKIKYKTPEQMAEMDDIRYKMGETKKEIGELEKEHTRATRVIMFNLLEQKLAQDGVIDEKDLSILQAVAGKWDLIGQAEVNAMLKAGEWDQFMHDNPLATAQEIAEYIAGIADKAITVTVNTEYNGTPYNDPNPQPGPLPGGEPQAYARGGSFVVPPGYPNDSYPLGPSARATSGERVTITPQGGGGAAALPAMNVYINNSMDLESFKRMLMQAMGR